MKKVKEIMDIGFVNHDKLVKSEWWTTMGFIGIGLGSIALVIGDSIRSKHTVWAKTMDDEINETNKIICNIIKEKINPKF